MPHLRSDGWGHRTGLQTSLDGSSVPLKVGYTQIAGRFWRPSIDPPLNNTETQQKQKKRKKLTVIAFHPF